MNRNQVRKEIVDALVNRSVYLVYFNSGSELHSQLRYGSAQRYSPDNMFISISSGSANSVVYIRNSISSPILIRKYL